MFYVFHLTAFVSQPLATAADERFVQECTSFICVPSVHLYIRSLLHTNYFAFDMEDAVQWTCERAPNIYDAIYLPTYESTEKLQVVTVIRNGLEFMLSFIFLFVCLCVCLCYIFVMAYFLVWQWLFAGTLVAK